MRTHTKTQRQTHRERSSPGSAPCPPWLSLPGHGDPRQGSRRAQGTGTSAPTHGPANIKPSRGHDTPGAAADTAGDASPARPLPRLRKAERVSDGHRAPLPWLF